VEFDFVLVDALLGTWDYKGTIRPFMQDVIQQINLSTVPVVSIIFPSGYIADTAPMPI